MRPLRGTPGGGYDPVWVDVNGLTRAISEVIIRGRGSVRFIFQECS